MREIYGNAWTVIAWLGGEQHGSTQAIQLVQDLSERTHCGHELEGILWQDPGYLGTGGWSALNKLMERRYWYRLWIIQEIVMGASAMVIRCGTSSIDWTLFCAGIGLLQENLWIVKDKILDHEGNCREIWHTTSLHLVYRDLSVLSQHDSAHTGLAFGRILDIANSANCRDPRDKVYGLAGLMESHITSRVSPDYNLPPSVVYAEVAKSFIQGYENLEPIREGNPWGPTQTPSWVADCDGQVDAPYLESRIHCGVHLGFQERKSMILGHTFHTKQAVKAGMRLHSPPTSFWLAQVSSLILFQGFRHVAVAISIGTQERSLKLISGQAAMGIIERP